MLYVLVTPARNEAAFIEGTIRSVVAQTQCPLHWVIVSDGSTDGTDDIVRRYAAQNPWIELLRMPEHRDRQFAAKANAFNAGYARLRELNLDYHVIGNLDADLSFGPDHFAFLMSKFADNPRLGVAGTPFREGETTYDYRFTSVEHVSGACQLFRRECFEAIGGYVPIKAGGIDLVAVVSARMKGWETRTFTDRWVMHHRKMGSAGHSALGAFFKGGFHDYLMGVHPVWQFCRCFYQISRPPWILRGSLLLTGYCWAALKRVPRPVSDQFVEFRRHEQMLRLRNVLRWPWKTRAAGPLRRSPTC